jgi:Leucine-rich repeat (LRR) protein
MLALQVVDLGFNKLRSCPADLLGCINNLLVLNMSYNRLDSWPEGLHMPGLVVLNLSFNKLQELPADMGRQLPALQQLYLANNFLSALPDSLAELELRDLFISENELQAVPKVGYSSCGASAAPSHSVA